MRVVFVLLAAMAAVAIGTHWGSDVPAMRSAQVIKPSLSDLEQQALADAAECQGGAHSFDDATCRKRDAAFEDLKNRGTCWTYSDDRVLPVDYDWHDCDQSAPVGFSPPAPVVEATPVDEHLVTREIYEQVRLGMTHDQVAASVGTPGVEQSSSQIPGVGSYQTYTWGNPDGSSMILQFQNGFLASKTQNSLPL